MKRKRRSRAELISICAAYESSGESAAAFARRRGIKQGTLSWWRAKLKGEGHQAKRSAAFVEVVNERLETSPRVVVLVGTVTIEFSGNVPPASWVAELFAQC